MLGLLKNLRGAPITGYRWYTSPDITWRRALVLGLIPASFFALLLDTTWGDNLQNRLARPLEFRLRHWLKRDPPLDPRIKIYAFDDRTLELLDESDLTLDDWLGVLKTFVARRPRAVFIDKFFGTPRGADHASSFVKGVAALPFPIITGGFISDVPTGRFPMEAGRAYSLIESSSRIPMLESKVYLYGPDRRVTDAFTHVGHLRYNGDFLMKAFFRTSPTEALPMASLLVASKREWRQGTLYLDSQPLPLDGQGRTLINLADPTTYFPKTYVFHNLVRLAHEGKSVKGIADDAIVVILPGMYTGSGDIVSSPFGLTPGGYLQVALINSVLTGRWLTVARSGWLIVLIAGLLGALLGTGVGPLSLLLILAALDGIQMTAGILLFAYGSFEYPWMFSSLAGSLSALLCFAERSRAAENKNKRLRMALDGFFPSGKIELLLKQPANLQLDPALRVVTIMFLDIAGFSLAAETQSPSKAFSELRELMARLADSVHAFDGVIDKTLGDGLLCFFGYSPTAQTASDRHVEQALRCAIRIQLENAQNITKAAQAGKPVFPLRIGVNTAEVCIGDLGNSRSIDLTMIGAGVNFAKRLEAACTNHSILLGQESHALLSRAGWSEFPLRLRQMQIKHHQKLFAAYECDPLAGAPELRQRANAAYYQFCGAEKKDPRHTIPDGVTLRLTSDSVNGVVLDYSRNGFMAQLDSYLCPGVFLELVLDSPDGELGKRLIARHLIPLGCEVRWGRAPESGNGPYLHGLMFTTSNEAQRGEVFEEISRHLASRTQDRLRLIG